MPVWDKNLLHGAMPNKTAFRVPEVRAVDRRERLRRDAALVGLTMLDVSVISVFYGAGDKSGPWADAISRAWQQLPESHRGQLQVLAVDNGSRTDAEFVRVRAPWVTLVEVPDNRGMAAGFNEGLARLKGEPIVVLLNPDAELSPDFFEQLELADWSDDIGGVGPKIIGADGELEQSARRFPTVWTGIFGRTSLFTRLFPQSRPVRRQLLAGDEPKDVDWISGACMIAPRDRFERIGGLDERYFLYWEDTDWCRRAWDKGMRVRYDPRLVIRHAQGTGGSGGSLRQSARTTVIFHRSAYRYYQEHVSGSPIKRAGAAVALVARCLTRLGVLLARQAHRRRGDGSDEAPTAGN